MGQLSFLVIDDQQAELDLLGHTLGRTFPDATVQALTDSRLALGTCQAHPFDCVIADFNMPNLDGLACAQGLRGQFPHLPIILNTGVGDEMLAAEAIKNGVTDYIPKARVTPESLRRTIGRAIHVAGQARIIEEQRGELEHFAYALAHDFKQPIRQISTFSSLVIEALRAGRSDGVEQYLTYLDTAASRLSNLVDVMSQYTLLSKPPEIGVVDLNAVLSSIRSSISPYLQDVGGQIIVHPAPAVLGNEALMEQVLQNLIINGLKYNKSEFPTVTITTSLSNDNCVIKVQDNGIGIEQEYIEDVFKPLVRLHNASEYTGSGLGLTLARKAIMAQGGTIWCESEFAFGSRFSSRPNLLRRVEYSHVENVWFGVGEMAMNKWSPVMSAPASDPALERLRMIVVEDEAWIAMMIEDVLIGLGCDVIGVAGNLPRAMTYVGGLAATDGAVLDVSLGGCDYSYDFADALIEGGVPFVFMTGYAPEFLESRFRHIPVLPKPVTPASLAAALADFPARSAGRRGA